MSFEKGQRVYTQDGTEYEFDHEAAGYALVAPIILVQTTNYRGDDFEEHEEVADHLVRFKAESISGDPWVKKIHDETKTALEEKKEKLSVVQREIGEAETALRMKKRELEDFEKSVKAEVEEIAAANPELKAFRQFVGRDRVFFLSRSSNGFGVRLGEETTASKLTLKRNGDVFESWGGWDDEERHGGDYYRTEPLFHSAVIKAFNERSRKDVEATAAWKEMYDFLSVDADVEEFIASEKAKRKAKDIEVLKANLQRAQDKLDKALADE